MKLTEITRKLIALVIRLHCKSLDRDCTAADRKALAAKKAHLQAVAVTDAAAEAEEQAEVAENAAFRNAIVVAANARLERERYGY